MRTAKTICMLLIAVFLAGCAAAPSSTLQVGDPAPVETYAPISGYTDLSDAFRSSRNSPFAEDAESYSLTCAGESGDACILSAQTVSLDGSRKMRIHCTWSPQDRIVFIGLKSAETGAFFILPCRTGSVRGTIDLGDIPAGEYSIVLCSNDNPSVTAVLLYQIQ